MAWTCAGWLFLLIATAHPVVWAQEALRSEVERMERLPKQAVPGWPQRLDDLLMRSEPGSLERLDLLFLKAGGFGAVANHRAMTEMEGLWREWHASAPPNLSVLAGPVASLAWSRYYRRVGLSAMARQELAGLGSRVPAAIAPKWAYRMLTAEADLMGLDEEPAVELQLREAALAAARLSGRPGRVATALSQLSSSQQRAGRYQQGIELAREATASAHQEPDDAESLAISYLTLGNALSDSDPEGALKAYEWAREHARRGGERIFEALVAGDLADLHLTRGHFEDALKVAMDGLALDPIAAPLEAHNLLRFNAGMAKIGLGRIHEGKADALMAIHQDLLAGDIQSAQLSWEELEEYLQGAGDLYGAFEAAQARRHLTRQVVLERQYFRRLALPEVQSVGGSAPAGKQALVIGNSAYETAALRNPSRDAQAVAQALRGQGFKVHLVTELRRDDIGSLLDGFLAELRAGDDVVVYYAGHGLQVRGINYLPAVDARMRSESDVALNSIDLNALTERLEEAHVGARLLLIDACRDNPFGIGWRQRGKGLGRMPAMPAGTLAHFAARPGAVASDGEGEHGAYTEQLLIALNGPQMPIELLLKSVGSAVRQSSRGAQEPWLEGSLDKDMILARHAPRSRSIGIAPRQ